MKIPGVEKWRVGVFDDDRRTLVSIANGRFTGSNFKYYRFKKDPITAKHFHDFAELFCVVEGRAMFLLVQVDNPEMSEVIEIIEGDVLLLPKRVAHIVRAQENTLIFAIAEREFISRKVSCHTFDFSGYEHLIRGY